MVPEGWLKTKLGDVGRIKSGATPLRSEGDRYFSDSGHPWVKTMDLNNGEIVNTTECITDAALKETSCSIFPRGTVLVAMYGGFNQIGRTGLLTKPSAINQAISAIKLNGDKAHPEYVLAFLNGHVKKWKRFAASSRKDPNITRDDVLGFPILLPPIAEQKKIAQILSAWDQAITATERLLENSQNRKKGLMQQLLTGNKRLPGFEGEWEEAEIRSLFSRVTTRNEGQSINVVTISGRQGLIRQQEFFKKSVASETLDGYYLLKRGQFAYNKSYSNGYPMGAIKRLNRYDDGVVTTLYICFEIADESAADSDFYEQYFESGLLNQGLMQIAHEGGRAHGLLNVKPSDFFSLKVRKPPLNEQKVIASLLVTADRELQAQKNRLEQLKIEKKALMQQLLTGKRRVKLETEAA